jgi:hypothetical protein
MKPPALFCTGPQGVVGQYASSVEAVRHLLVWDGFLYHGVPLRAVLEDLEDLEDTLIRLDGLAAAICTFDRVLSPRNDRRR